MTELTLADFGWSAHFARQISDDDTPARVAAIHRDRLDTISPTGPLTLACADSGSFAVGDWVIHDGTFATHRLTPTTSISRRAPGDPPREQLIVANVDTLGIVTSCNADFNPARLERYLAIAATAGAMPLVILTKADLSSEADTYRRQAERLSPLVTALALDATDLQEATRLAPWCRDGQTLALVGSSGVGKTTLQNALTGEIAATGGIREDDAKGRHTTTGRSLRRTLHGGWLIDTPGVRELGLSGAADGIDAVFEDIIDLVAACRFSDCQHETEPGCAVRAAIEAGALDPERLARWEKLKREDEFNSRSVHDAHNRARAFGKKGAQGMARAKFKRRGPGS